MYVKGIYILKGIHTFERNISCVPSRDDWLIEGTIDCKHRCLSLSAHAYGGGRVTHHSREPASRVRAEKEKEKKKDCCRRANLNKRVVAEKNLLLCKPRNIVQIL